jgi:hypothetical protein
MKNNVNIQRRKLLKLAGISAAALATFPSLLNAKISEGTCSPCQCNIVAEGNSLFE